MNVDSLVMFSSLDDFFSERTRNIQGCQEPTKAYITNVFRTTNANFAGESLTLIFAKASFEYKFETFQNLGDWLLFAKSVYPSSLNDASPEYYDALAQTSYYRCYRILDRKWVLFEELADTFPRLVRTLQPLMSPFENSAFEPGQFSSRRIIHT